MCIMEKMSGRVKREAGNGDGVIHLGGVNRKNISEKMPFKQKPERSEVAVKRRDGGLGSEDSGFESVRPEEHEEEDKSRRGGRWLGVPDRRWPFRSLYVLSESLVGATFHVR